ncbi:MAG: hypothetical protein ABIH83_02680 [Candidatus Micrarchaeota archaeon]
MNIKLLKYHVLRCPKCGHMRTSTTRKKTRCIKCAHGWEISHAGGTFGVLASFYTPAQAVEYVQKFKELREEHLYGKPEIKTASALLEISEESANI